MANDVIQHDEMVLKWIVYKYPENEIKKGTDLLVRAGQEVVLFYNGNIADCYGPGRYTLDEEAMPKLIAFGERFVLPKKAVRTDIYFINTTVFMNNGWGTKDPIICKDPQLDIVRLKAFGTFAFKVADPKAFINSVAGTRLIGSGTQEAVRYISNTLSQMIAIVLAQTEHSVLEIAAHYIEIAQQLKEKAQSRMQDIGVELTEVQVEHIGTTDTVSESIDDFTGMQLAKKDFESFERYQMIKSMREGASKPGTATIDALGSALGREIGRIVDKD